MDDIETGFVESGFEEPPEEERYQKHDATTAEVNRTRVAEKTTTNIVITSRGDHKSHEKQVKRASQRSKKSSPISVSKTKTSIEPNGMGISVNVNINTAATTTATIKSTEASPAVETITTNSRMKERFGSNHSEKGNHKEDPSKNDCEDLCVDDDDSHQHKDKEKTKRHLKSKQPTKTLLKHKRRKIQQHKTQSESIRHEDVNALTTKFRGVDESDKKGKDDGGDDDEVVEYRKFKQELCLKNPMSEQTHMTSTVTQSTDINKNETEPPCLPKQQQQQQQPLDPVRKQDENTGRTNKSSANTLDQILKAMDQSTKPFVNNACQNTPIPVTDNISQNRLKQTEPTTDKSIESEKQKPETSSDTNTQTSKTIPDVTASATTSTQQHQLSSSPPQQHQSHKSQSHAESYATHQERVRRESIIAAIPRLCPLGRTATNTVLDADRQKIWPRLVGMTDVKELLWNVILKPMAAPALYKKLYGNRSALHFCIIGPRGSGKRKAIAMACAFSCVDMVTISPHRYRLGDITLAIDYACEEKPCVICLDGFEQLERIPNFRMEMETELLGMDELCTKWNYVWFAFCAETLETIDNVTIRTLCYERIVRVNQVEPRELAELFVNDFLCCDGVISEPPPTSEEWYRLTDAVAECTPAELKAFSGKVVLKALSRKPISELAVASGTRVISGSDEPKDTCKQAPDITSNSMESDGIKMSNNVLTTTTLQENNSFSMEKAEIEPQNEMPKTYRLVLSWHDDVETSYHVLSPDTTIDWMEKYTVPRFKSFNPSVVE